LCNGKESLYVPINHISSTRRTRLTNQIPVDELRALFLKEGFNPRFKWVYHNARFDLRSAEKILRCTNASTILGYFNCRIYYK